TIRNNAATIDAAVVGLNNLYTPGRSLEFVATFSGDPNEHVGFGVDLSAGSPWAIFSTYPGGGALYARMSNGGAGSALRMRDVWIPAGGNSATWLNAPHRFRIDWNVGNVAWFIDGSLVAEQSIPITPPMRPLIADVTVPVGSGAISMQWLRMTPYAPSGTFVSRVFDAGAIATWGAASWSTVTPPNTSVAIVIRQGNTPVPDSSWTSFALLPSSGAPIPASSRYLQYAAQLAT